MPRSVSASLRAAFLLLIAICASGIAHAQATLSTERDKLGYAIGIDVAGSVGPAMPDMDLAAFQRAMENGLSGGKPLLDEAASKAASNALMASINARKTPGAKPVVVDRGKVGLLVGGDVGRSLSRIRGEFDLPMFLAGFKAATDPAAKRLLSAEEVRSVLAAFSTRLAAAEQAKTAAQAQANLKQGEAFLASNKAVKGVFTTPSGLQYMILRQGNGPRAKPGQRVRVNYEGCGGKSEVWRRIRGRRAIRHRR